MMDRLSQGRLNFGVAASGLPSDWQMFNVDGMSGENRDMTREALDIILRLWSDEPEFDYKGKFWHVTKGAEMFGFLRRTCSPCRSRIRPSASPGFPRTPTRSSSPASAASCR